MSTELKVWRREWQDDARATWQRMHTIVAREEASQEKSRRIEALKLIAASLIYDANAVHTLPDDHLTLAYGNWLPRHPTLATDLPQEEIPLFDKKGTAGTVVYLSSMHIPSAAIRLSSALCLVASEKTTSTFALLCKPQKKGENRDWDRDTLLQLLETAACSASRVVSTKTTLTPPEHVAALVAHRDQFGHGRENGGKASGAKWRQVRGKLFREFFPKLMLDGHLELIKVALAELK